MVKVNYDAETGDIKGYYLNSIKYPNIPTPYLELTKEQYTDCVNHPGERKVDLATLTIIQKPITINLEDRKLLKLTEINSWTKAKIIGGFVSTASGASVTYDSDEDTQSTMQTMYVATKSPDFANHPDYQGVIPVRGFADGSTVKTVFYLTATQVQKFMDDLALHIGKCKQAGWAKQALVEKASTVEDLNNIIL